MMPRSADALVRAGDQLQAHELPPQTTQQLHNPLQNVNI